MVEEIFYTGVIWGLYSCLLFYILITLLLFLNFYKKLSYRNLSVDFISLAIILIITLSGLVIIKWLPQYRLLPGLPLSILTFFITYIAWQKYSFIFRSENYSLSFPWLGSISVTALILTLSGVVASYTNSLILVNGLLSLLPFKINMEPARLNFFLRKTWHVLIYSTLYLVWFKALLVTTNLPRRWVTICSLGLCLLVAVIDESCQTMAPGRYGQVRDVFLDMGVVSLLALLAHAYDYVARRRIQRSPTRV
jgi:VanZ family protein